MSGSASHWCKSVVEEAVQPTVGIASFTTSQQNNTTTQGNLNQSSYSSQQLNPQYLQMYQEFYRQQAAGQSISNQQTQQVEPLSYKAILTQNNPMQLQQSPSVNPAWHNQTFQHNGSISAGGMFYTQAGTTNNQFVNPVSTSSIPATSIATSADPRVQKKPNPSRFTSLSSVDNIQNTATAPSTTVASSQGVKQPTSMNDFVKRAFAACTNDSDRQVITAELQKLIQRISADGRINIHRWDLEPTPVPPSVKAAMAAKAQAATAEESKKRKSRWATTEELHPLPPSPANAGSTVSFIYNSLSTEPAKKKSALSGVANAPTKEELQMREKRASRFQDDHKLMTPRDGSASTAAAANNTNNKNNMKGKGKKKGGGVTLLGSAGASSASLDTEGNFDMENLKIVGTCQKLEKDYLRLTSAPHHSVVRPESILRKTIQLLKKKWANDEVDYVYMCSQLKSLRQDLTVQHITNDFTVHVYETHARVALECNDTNEYNQCQTQLKHLYAAGHKGSEMEFVAYRILYYVYLLGNKKYTGGSSDLAFLLASLKPEAHTNEAVSHALRVRRAVQQDNYYSFFKLYKVTPNMGNYLLDLMIDNFRLQTLQKICRAYKPTLSLEFALQTLALDETREEGIELFKKAGLLLVGTENSEGMEINTKDSVVDMSAFLTQEKLLL